MGQEGWNLEDASESPGARAYCYSKTGKRGKQQALLTPYQLGRFHLAHRIVHPPLTRCRAFGGIPQPDAATYYSQRASFQGLLIGEATDIMPADSQYPDTPGIYTDEQIDAWKVIVKAVHDKGAVFFCQIWHAGRDTFSETDTPKLVEKFRIAARNAISAGFDGVEIHGAHGYLMGHELISQQNDISVSDVIQRTACREALEIVKAVGEDIGADRVGFRCSPYADYFHLKDIDQVELGIHLASALNDCNVLYASFVESRGEFPAGYLSKKPGLELFRKVFKSSFIAAGGYTRENGNAAI